ncbi:hypothetical protein D7X94_08665 [Acutalibacter sp. 1XD8-33]|uniref:hypothetical protein n=1 Tax=Acutalibacter sp. 1XD8-33 TaxID=2320081 RepID=UPI000EA0AC99|nr:hypothetical protein [Acutalibacter sp. 1XD8-33]RKJ40209.1 hypothetical protein D7X94_08665 [Acutalibacter sp. 1XD8-33]
MLPVLIRRELEELSFRVYVTDALQAVEENTAVSAAFLTNGKAGKVLSVRWAQRILDQEAPAPREERTREEIVDHIREKIAALPPG